MNIAGIGKKWNQRTSISQNGQVDGVLTSSGRPESIAPQICVSGGIFLVVLGLLVLLPGRDTATYLKNGNARSLTEAVDNQYTLVSDTGTQNGALPDKNAVVLARGRFYHWDRECELLHPPAIAKVSPVEPMTGEQAKRLDYVLCPYCGRIY